jgi:hypothetical protein
VIADGYRPDRYEVIGALVSLSEQPGDVSVAAGTYMITTKAQVADLGLLGRAEDGNRTRSISLGIYGAECVSMASELWKPALSGAFRGLSLVRF